MQKRKIATSLLFYRLWPCLTSRWRHRSIKYGQGVASDNIMWCLLTAVRIFTIRLLVRAIHQAVLWLVNIDPSYDVTGLWNMLKWSPLGRFYDIYVCLTPFYYSGLFYVTNSWLLIWLKISTFWSFLTFLWRTRSKNKVNIIVYCRVRRDLSNAVWIFTLQLLLLKIQSVGNRAVQRREIKSLFNAAFTDAWTETDDFWLWQRCCIACSSTMKRSLAVFGAGPRNRQEVRLAGGSAHHLVIPLDVWGDWCRLFLCDDTTQQADVV